MVATVQKQLTLEQAELISVIKDFSQYLLSQKKNHGTFLEISNKSNFLIDSWGVKSKAQQPFFFQGTEEADVFILDSTTDFFKGQGGNLLIKILAAMDLKPDSVFICNAGDLTNVHEKIINISPKVIITLGSKAFRLLLQNRQSLSECRGKFYEYQGIKLMPTFHPVLLLKQPVLKRKVWEDMKKVMEYRGARYES
jgi:uracil-DNA glycosylase